MLTRDEERAPWGMTACHWLSPEVRHALVWSMIWSQRLSGIEVTYEQGEASLFKVLHEPMVELG